MIDSIVNLLEIGFRDRTHPLEVWNEENTIRKCTFPRKEVLRLMDELRDLTDGSSVPYPSSPRLTYEQPSHTDNTQRVVEAEARRVNG